MEKALLEYKQWHTFGNQINLFSRLLGLNKANLGPLLGHQSVEIHCERKTGRKIQAAMRERGELMDETVEGIPAQFNQRTTLTNEVKSGDNEANFDLNPW